MAHPLQTSEGKAIATHWDGRDFLGRLKLVLENCDLFWSLGLVTRSELEMCEAMSASAVEYVLHREEQPFFTSLHLKKNVEAQYHREKLLAALRAAFCN